MSLRNRPTTALAAALVSAGLLLAACGSGSEAPETPQLGDRPPPTEAATTTTTVEVTTTTLPVEVVDDIPAPGSWGAAWDGPPSPVTLGSIDPGEFDLFILDNAPDDEELTPEEVVSTYLQLDPDDPNIQMLRGERGGPESVDIYVIESISDDDSVRARRWEFSLEMRNRDFLTVAEDETAAAGEGDAAPADEQTDTNEGDAATSEDVEVEKGPGQVPWILTIGVTVQCQPGRGQQDFTTGTCA